MNSSQPPHNWSQLLATEQLLFLKPSSERRLILFAIEVLRADLEMIWPTPNALKHWGLDRLYRDLLFETIGRIERSFEEISLEGRRAHTEHLATLLKEISVAAQHFELAVFIRDMQRTTRRKPRISPLDFAHLLCRGSLPPLNSVHADFSVASRNDATIKVSRTRHNEIARRLLSEVFEPEREQIEFDPRWRTSDVVDVARGIYEDRAFERMPILADALMDAGCENSEIIAHCRGSGPHVRGCWLMDMILGKE